MNNDAYHDLKFRAITLRKQGLSYSEILSQIPVSKSTISLWLHSVGLAKYQKQRITQKRIDAQKRGAEAKRTLRVQKTSRIRSAAIQELPNIIQNPLWVIGTAIYWAEGAKAKAWNPSADVDFCNMDARMIKVFVKWIKECCDIKIEDLTFNLYIHTSGDVSRAVQFWSKQLMISANAIIVYFKRHKVRTNRKNINTQYYGLMRIRVRRSTDLNRKIAGWTEGMIKYLKIGE